MQRIFLALLAILLSACTSSGRIPERPAAAPSNEVALYALSLADTPYRYGGNSADSGFDCSGFVQHVYLNTLGIRLPRTSAEMGRTGIPLDISQLHPGDLVFFNTQHRPYSHVGIYVGNERFVHSPSSGKSVTVTSMREKFWRNRYNGARRITSAN